jgi:hypothetical protein
LSTNNITFEDLPLDDMGQAAFTAYVDAALGTEAPHDRLSNGSRSAALAVAAVLRDAGLLRTAVRQPATHGTTSGYNTGCRCEFCTEARNLHQRAVRHNNEKQGHNKIREEQ